MATQYYQALTHPDTPYVSIYAQDGDVSTKLANPATLPTGAGNRKPAWSPDNTYLAIPHTSSPYITIYKRAGDVFTKLADPATLPPSTGFSAAFSADGTYLSVTHTTSPYITIYKRAGDVFTKLADPATLPPGFPRSSAFSGDGTYLSVVNDTSPYITIYKRAGDVFTKLADPAALPAGGGTDTSWAPNGTYMSVAHNTSPYITIYKRAGDVFTKLADPATLPSNFARKSTWSYDGNYLSVTNASSPYLTIYSRSGDVFTKLANPASLPTSQSMGNAYTPSGLNAAPTAPTWAAPADNSYNDIDSALPLDWVFNDPDASDTQSAYALSKSVDGGTLSYWNAGTSAWGAGEIKNPTATTSVTLASSWATAGQSIEYKVKTWDAADAVGPYGSGLTVNTATGDAPTITAPATSAVLATSAAVITWTVAAQAAYKIRVLSSADAELFTTGKVTGAVTEVTLSYVFTDGATGLKIELTTFNSFDIAATDTNTGISVDYTPPATPVLTVTAIGSYISVAIADPTPTGSQPTVDSHDIYVRVAAGGRQSGQRTVNDDGIRISTGTVPTNGTYQDFCTANTDFEYRTFAVSDSGAGAFSAWT